MKTEYWYSDAAYYVDVMTCSKAFSCGMRTVEAELDYYYPTLVRVFDFIDYSSVYVLVTSPYTSIEDSVFANSQRPTA